MLIDGIVDGTRWLFGWMFEPDVMRKNEEDRIKAERREKVEREIMQDAVAIDTKRRAEKNQRERRAKEQKRLQDAREQQLQGDRNAAAFEAERAAKSAEFLRKKREREKK